MRKTDFHRAQERVFERYGLDFESKLVAVPSISGKAHVIVTGEGPPVLMVIGGGIVAGTWAPLMAQLTGFTLHAVDLPGQGLSDSTPYSPEDLHKTGVSFLEEVMDALDLEAAPFIGQSMGGLWSTWMAVDRPSRVSAICYIACPAAILGTSAPFPLRLGTIPWLNHLIQRLDPPSTAQVERLGRIVGQDLRRLPELRDLMLEYERLPESSESLLDLHRAVIRLRGARPTSEITARQLREVTKPVQFIWGERDPFGDPFVGMKAAAIMSSAEIHIVPGGHAPWFNDPGRIAAIAHPFLARHTKGAGV